MKKLGLLLLAPLMLVGCNSASHDTGWVDLSKNTGTQFTVFIGYDDYETYTINDSILSFKYKYTNKNNFSELTLKVKPNFNQAEYTKYYCGYNVSYLLTSY